MNKLAQESLLTDSNFKFPELSKMQSEITGASYLENIESKEWQ